LAVVRFVQCFVALFGVAFVATFAMTFAAAGLMVGPAGALGGGPWSPPVGGPVVRGFDPPRSQFGPGHLGVDYAVAPGTPVHAAGAGVVVFAGRVGESMHVVVLHAGEVRTTDSFLATVAVVTGQAVGRGAILGTSGGTGAGHAGGVLHFGVRVGTTYVDPMLLFAPPDLAAIVHLAEPLGGAANPAAPPASRSDGLGEWASLAASLGVDARPRSAPPAWWSDPSPTPLPPGGSAPRRATANPTGPAPSALASGSSTSGGSAGSTIARDGAGAGVVTVALAGFGAQHWNRARRSRR
jgi:murein DD-endopeptidase MepM/ murein hydrolase activator NlpD